MKLVIHVRNLIWANRGDVCGTSIVCDSDPEEGDEVTKEWVKKSSSRIWRGSLSKHVWKYLSKGAWAPKKNPKPLRQRRSGSAPKQARRQRAQGGPIHMFPWHLVICFGTWHLCAWLAHLASFLISHIFLALWHICMCGSEYGSDVARLQGK